MFGHVEGILQVWNYAEGYFFVAVVVTAVVQVSLFVSFTSPALTPYTHWLSKLLLFMMTQDLKPTIHKVSGLIPAVASICSSVLEQNIDPYLSSNASIWVCELKMCLWIQFNSE